MLSVEATAREDVSRPSNSVLTSTAASGDTGTVSAADAKVAEIALAAVQFAAQPAEQFVAPKVEAEVGVGVPPQDSSSGSSSSDDDERAAPRVPSKAANSEASKPKPRPKLKPKLKPEPAASNTDVTAVTTAAALTKERTVEERIAEECPAIEGTATDISAAANAAAVVDAADAANVATAAEERAVEARAVEERAVKERMVKERMVEARAAEKRAAEERAAEERAADNRAAEARADELRAADERATAAAEAKAAANANAKAKAKAKAEKAESERRRLSTMALDEEIHLLEAEVAAEAAGKHRAAEVEKHAAKQRAAEERAAEECAAAKAIAAAEAKAAAKAIAATKEMERRRLSIMALDEEIRHLETEVADEAAAEADAHVAVKKSPEEAAPAEEAAPVEKPSSAEGAAPRKEPAASRDSRCTATVDLHEMKLGLALTSRTVDGVKCVVVKSCIAGGEADVQGVRKRCIILSVNGTEDLAGIVQALNSKQRPLRLIVQNAQSKKERRAEAEAAALRSVSAADENARVEAQCVPKVHDAASPAAAELMGAPTNVAAETAGEARAVVEAKVERADAGAGMFAVELRGVKLGLSLTSKTVNGVKRVVVKGCASGSEAEAQGVKKRFIIASANGAEGLPEIVAALNSKKRPLRLVMLTVKYKKKQLAEAEAAALHAAAVADESALEADHVAKDQDAASQVSADTVNVPTEVEAEAAGEVGTVAKAKLDRTEAGADVFKVELHDVKLGLSLTSKTVDGAKRIVIKACAAGSEAEVQGVKKRYIIASANGAEGLPEIIAALNSKARPLRLTVVRKPRVEKAAQSFASAPAVYPGTADDIMIRFDPTKGERLGIEFRVDSNGWLLVKELHRDGHGLVVGNRLVAVNDTKLPDRVEGMDEVMAAVKAAAGPVTCHFRVGERIALKTTEASSLAATNAPHSGGDATMAGADSSAGADVDLDASAAVLVTFDPTKGERLGIELEVDAHGRIVIKATLRRNLEVGMRLIAIGDTALPSWVEELDMAVELVQAATGPIAVHFRAEAQPNYAELLREILEQHAPHDLAQADSILAQFEGNEVAVLAALRTKYAAQSAENEKKGLGWQADGSFFDVLKDESRRTLLPDGSVIVLHQDGSRTGKHPGGSRSHTTSDGHRVTKYSDGSILHEDFGSNRAMREWPDGRLQQRLEDNTVVEGSHLTDEMMPLAENEHELPPIRKGGAAPLV